MSYIGNQPVLASSYFTDSFDVTSATQSVFNSSGIGDEESLYVFRNGVRLGTADFSIGSDNATITLTNAAVSGDIVVVSGFRDVVQGVQVTEHVEEIIATASTTVTHSTPSMLNHSNHVYLNGVRQQLTGANSTTPDVTINASTGVITFASTLAAGDIVTIVSREQSVSDDISQVSHYSALPNSFTVPQGVNQSFFGPTTYEGTVTVAGNLVHAHGALNLTGTMSVSGSLNVV
ncbi:MAG: hypothetical protein CBC12_10690 [Candidatus Puniceispirillum sp. TMED52]|nr:MAG: hypothetical protein CBC12_10690 [Candidatus Puniceispirillum sp. TMED52]|tara:strand:- start:710 stop:1408 length:699 start_codon:yes stop_codon:yes gene_type:complete